MEERHCDTCMHETLPSGIAPCCNCIAHDEWKPKGEIDLGGPITGIDIGMPDGTKIPVGIDPGAPEGDKTNVRLDWGERGAELIGPVDITSVDKLKDGPLLETARAVVKQITRLDYAIEGVRSKMYSIGLKFTDKTLSRDELTLLVCQLNELQADLFELEDEREALRKARQVPKP